MVGGTGLACRPAERECYEFANRGTASCFPGEPLLSRVAAIAEEVFDNTTRRFLVPLQGFPRIAALLFPPLLADHFE